MLAYLMIFFLCADTLHQLAFMRAKQFCALKTANSMLKIWRHKNAFKAQVAPVAVCSKVADLLLIHYLLLLLMCIGF